jgi:hypothetical protein
LSLFDYGNITRATAGMDAAASPLQADGFVILVGSTKVTGSAFPCFSETVSFGIKMSGQIIPVPPLPVTPPVITTKVKVPEIVRTTLGVGQALIDTAGLALSVTEVPPSISNPVNQGRFLSQSPVAGTTVLEGSIVHAVLEKQILPAP